MRPAPFPQKSCITSINADQALTKVLGMAFDTVLDIGAGVGHAEAFREAGKSVTTLNFSGADINGDYLKTSVPVHDCIWASHVLEHQTDPGAFLRKCFGELPYGGILAVTVPPLKHALVGGHVTLWNAGLLLYQLILAGFDCSKASVKTYGYNISVIVRKAPANLPALNHDFGDIQRLAPFFPFHVEHGDDGRITEVNW